jgi:hypothetical protein
VKQTRRASLVESIANVTIGYGIAVGSQILVFPLFGLIVPLRDNIEIGVIFTAISLVRSFVLRRTFEFLRVRNVLA